MGARRYRLWGLWLLAVTGVGTSGCRPRSGDAVAAPGLPVIGAVEEVTVLPQGFVYAARVDTGAATCSLHAEEITPASEGTAVRFTLVDPRSGRSETVTAPLTRVARIKRHGLPDEERPVVRLRVALGAAIRPVEFSLVDRRGFEYPMLIGRNLLAGRFLVDSAGEYRLRDGGGA